LRIRLCDHYTVSIDRVSHYLEIAARLRPKTTAAQRVQHAQLVAEPAGHAWHETTDMFGNHLARARLAPHPMQLRLTALSELDLAPAEVPPALRPTVQPGAPDPRTAPDGAVASYARRVTRGVPAEPAAVLRALAEAVAQDIPDDPRATTIATSAAGAFAAGAGVCQDRAHIVIAAAHALGLPAYYIGGYRLAAAELAAGRETIAIPHAWVGLTRPGAAPAALDPGAATGQHSYIALACGRSFDDVQPLRIHGEGARFRTARARATARAVV